ncbi:hypothetical protein [Rhodopila sp.]|uniref:hypothetical protein n=1 Tax=Rhodopila sp. TaxID=2480087 RepID=UPI003D1248EF
MFSTPGSAARSAGSVARPAVGGGAVARVMALGVVMLLGACAASPDAAFRVLPGPGKDQAAFGQDQAVCQQHAVAHTGYGTPAPPTAGAAAKPGAIAATGVPFDATGYLQCMASRGDTVQAQPSAYPLGIYPDEYPYAYQYGYPYAYSYGVPAEPGYPYPFYDGALYGGLGLGFGFGGGRFFHGSFHHGFHHGGFEHHGFEHHGFGHGGFEHGGFEHGGFGHGSFGHGGFGHGGFGHGGVGHGGFGHR